ncbi:MAG: hypothetical protein IJZ85_11190 [Lachnospiraceae bacterium]|nr:hypothetical protein [Lachnospiraceae bacterium]
MSYFVALDAGGTKTDAVLFDDTGHILHLDRSEGCNPLDIGAEAAQERLFKVISRVLKQAPGAVCAVYGGIAGTYYVGDRFNEFLRPKFEVSIRIDDDGCNLISGTLGHNDGCGMVCGTGAALFGRIGGKAGKDLIHIGGYGWMIYTGGSGFELGRDALRETFRARDGLGEKTILTELFKRELGRDAYACMPEFYEGGRAYIASFAHLVFEGRKAGDPICQKIFETGAKNLAELTHAAQKHFPGEFPVVLGGGIFGAFPEYVEAVRSFASPRAKLISAEYPPVLGAAIEALWDGGMEPAKGFRERFLADYVRLKG